eukprot:scaffold87046_cov30-Attheya_sp.AAC.2
MAGGRVPSVIMLSLFVARDSSANLSLFMSNPVGRHVMLLLCTSLLSLSQPLEPASHSFYMVSHRNSMGMVMSGGRILRCLSQPLTLYGVSNLLYWIEWLWRELQLPESDESV